MSIAEQTLETLEFPKIRERLARYVSFSASRELALTLRPATEYAAIVRRQRFTSEARRLLDEAPDVTLGAARDIRDAAQLAARGGLLEASTMLEIGGTLRSVRTLRSLLLKLEPEAFALLRALGEEMPQVPALEEEIERTIGDEGEVLDSASPKLARLRRELRTTDARLQERMHSFIAGQHASALQEAIVTVRAGRYVVPVKAAQRRAIPGIVHDQSASGATLYIEPMAAVDLNNQWREAQLAIEQEIKRILAALSQRVGSHADELVAGVEILAQLDLGLAQAKYAAALRCVRPKYVDEHWQPPASNGTAVLPQQQAPLLITQARHPLLDQSSVVPIDLWLGGDFRLLLITGPNTGGKTVALKTVGLLALMAQAGLHIPAGEPSRLPVFAHIFADIGDEQSIEQSLSTFSSHMTNIIHILGAIEAQQATYPPPSGGILVLLDELGAGTDPVEGAALARAISGRLLERGCLGVCTTHYAELKVFAHNTPGVQNASVEFDVDTLAPTYRLTIGLPGRSNALAIAARLGLDSELVQQARSTMSGEEAQLEDLLATIHHEREAAAAALQRADAVRADAEKYRERHQAMLQELEESLQTRLDEADREIEHELSSMRAELRRMRNETRSTTLSRQWMQEAEQRLQAMQEHAHSSGQRVLSAVPAPPRSPQQQAATQPPRPLQPGDTVQVRSVGLTGEILSIDEEDAVADVQVGGFRMQVGLGELRREKAGSSSQSTPARRPTAPPERSLSLPDVPDVSMTFDMRGWRASEVSEKLERYLNDAYLAGLPEVRLVHGKGSGVLRQVVRDILQQHPLIASFRGGGSEGGEGVTLARLKER